MFDPQIIRDATSQIELLLKAVPISFTALMPCVNPIGTAIILSSLTVGTDPVARKQLARRISCNAALLLIGSLLVGSHLLQFFGVSVPIVQAVGGFVLASMGWKMLNKQDSAEEHDKTSAIVPESSSIWSRVFYPFTFPITVGPGCVAVAITLSAHSQSEDMLSTALIQTGDIIGIIAVSTLVYLCFQYSTFVTKSLGQSGTAVLMRLISFLVACIGIQISWEGIQVLLQQVGR
jgi:multiple antibiotic resistance protein